MAAPNATNPTLPARRTPRRPNTSATPSATSAFSRRAVPNAIDGDTSSRRVRERFATLERERRETLTRELRRLRVDQVTLSTDQDWLLALGRHLR